MTRNSNNELLTRREAATLIGASAAGLLCPGRVAFTQTANDSSAVLTRAIPVSGEKLPVIGLGTWQAFDVGPSEAERGPLDQVLRSFLKMGGRVVDSSPMYGRAEQVLGELVTNLGTHSPIFWATKVWTRGKQAAIDSMERSFTRLQTKRIDLMQVHNLVDVDTHLGTMRDWKAQGRLRYIGLTHYNSSAFTAVEEILRREKLDFLQINYSIMEREAEQRILPLAQEREVAVIANRPLGGGDLFSRIRGKKLPGWATEFDCQSWAQFFLKWIIGHSAVTCAIPATNKVNHLEDNMRAGFGPLPDEATRRRMADFVSAL